MTVHFGSNDRPVWLKTVHFWTDRPLSRDRPLSPFWTVHFGPDSGSEWSSRSLISVRQMLFGFAKYSLLFAKLNWVRQLKLGSPTYFFAKLFAKSPWPKKLLSLSILVNFWRNFIIHRSISHQFRLRKLPDCLWWNKLPIWWWITISLLYFSKLK